MTTDVRKQGGTIQKITLKPIKLIDNDAFQIEFYQHHSPFTFNIQHATHKVILILSLHGQIQYQSPLEELVGSISEAEFNLLYYPAKRFEINLESTAGELMVIHFDIHHWLSWLPKSDDLRTQIQSAIIGKMGTSLYPTNLSATTTIKNIVQDIHLNQYEDIYLKQYTIAKVLELMVLIAHPINIPKGKDVDLNDDELEKMYKAKNIITKNLAESCSIISLAQQVGTNECYLKKNFKKAFGDTVYQYLLQERMERAKELLLNTDKKIATIAKEIGYKNASHFSVAYKKHFGVLPNQERGTS